MAITGAALPAFSATFSTWDGCVCRPDRMIFTLRLCLCAAPTKFSIVVLVPAYSPL
jgi:hypothetical protein